MTQYWDLCISHLFKSPLVHAWESILGVRGKTFLLARLWQHHGHVCACTCMVMCEWWLAPRLGEVP